MTLPTKTLGKESSISQELLVVDQVQLQQVPLIQIATRNGKKSSLKSSVFNMILNAGKKNYFR